MSDLRLVVAKLVPKNFLANHTVNAETFRHFFIAGFPQLCNDFGKFLTMPDDNCFVGFSRERCFSGKNLR